MKPLRGRREGSDCNILRQVAVELTEKGGWVHRLRQFDIGNLAQGVDAGVGASGAMQLDGLPSQAAEDGLQFSLYGLGRVSLYLPAAIACAVVLN